MSAASTRLGVTSPSHTPSVENGLHVRPNLSYSSSSSYPPSLPYPLLLYQLKLDLYRRHVTDLLIQPLAQEAFMRNSGHVRHLYIDHPTNILLSLLSNAPRCSNLAQLECEIVECTTELYHMVHQSLGTNDECEFRLVVRGAFEVH
ncbi:hypothetical protein MVEG_05594 [Podila verticillata NRRL 6337]|nr:hypothetical protein MVEG_05594 [Podila verticillata NRRL 6337]